MSELSEKKMDTSNSGAPTTDAENSNPLFDEILGDALIKDTIGEPAFSAYMDLFEGEAALGSSDRNSDSHLDSRELLCLDGRPAFATNLQLNIELVQESANDEYFDENNGVSSRDLEARLKDKIENVTMHGRVHESKHGVEIDAIANDDLMLHSLHIKNANTGTEINWHSNGNFLVKKEPSEAQKTIMENKKSYEENSDDHKEAILGKDGFDAYRNLVELGDLAIFDKIDADLDGHLTSEELSDFALEQRVKEIDERKAKFEKENRLYFPHFDRKPIDPMEKIATDALDNIDSLEEWSNDEWGDENEGITRADLKQAYWQHIAENADQIASNIEQRLRTGMPGTRNQSSNAAEIEDTISGIKYTQVGDHTIVNVKDNPRNVNTSLDVQKNLISTDLLLDVSFNQ